MDVSLDKAGEHHSIQILTFPKPELQWFLSSKKQGRWQTNSLSCCSFTLLAESLFQVRRQLEKLDELLTRLTYDGDPIPVQRPQLLEKVNFLLYNLFRKCVSHCQSTKLYLSWYNSENMLLRGRKNGLNV